ncbi:MAG TPA: porin family protein [Thermoanaerobaculia bacterium]|nr:porin family protein [Thermoanaerobaculia bacterium]
MVQSRRFTLLFLLALVALISFLATPAEAQPLQKGDFELGFGVGTTWFDDAYTEEDADYRFEARGGYFLTDNFELELEAARSVGVLDLNLDTFFLNAVLNFPVGGRAVPYVLVGGGVAQSDETRLFSDDGFSADGAAYQAAIGSRFFFGEDSRVAARFELSSTFEELLDDTSNHLSLTAGLVWRLGGR